MSVSALCFLHHKCFPNVCNDDYDGTIGGGNDGNNGKPDFDNEDVTEAPVKDVSFIKEINMLYGNHFNTEERSFLETKCCVRPSFSAFSLSPS